MSILRIFTKKGRLELNIEHSYSNGKKLYEIDKNSDIVREFEINTPEQYGVFNIFRKSLFGLMSPEIKNEEKFRKEFISYCHSYVFLKILEEKEGISILDLIKTYYLMMKGVFVSNDDILKNELNYIVTLIVSREYEDFEKCVNAVMSNFLNMEWEKFTDPMILKLYKSKFEIENVYPDFWDRPKIIRDFLATGA